MLKINPTSLDFDLPEDRIAQAALPIRDQARLLVVDRHSKKIQHKKFFQLIDHLSAGDVLVLNKAKVNHAKVIGHKKTGGRVEMLFLGVTERPGVWKSLVRPFLKVGTEIVLPNGAELRLVGRNDQGENLLDTQGHDMDALLAQHGEVPLPPYIKRPEGDMRKATDSNDYQTVYAAVPGSIAAPTAGLHFTESLLKQIKDKGVEVLFLTLHVGWGTFKPVNDVQQHVMLAERYELDAPTWKALQEARHLKKRIVAVGTTATRVLESLSGNEPVGPLSGETRIFIRPGFVFNWVSSLVTNFHVPKSTPISLVAAFAGFELIEQSYAEAIQQDYRFFSYGDAMLIL